MLHLPISQARSGGATSRTQRRSDHAMDIFQYGTAFLAIVVAVLLAAVR
jgi:hypothetical protein